jgi:hypothetical protein
MDIKKSKMNFKKIQYQSLVWTKDVNSFIQYTTFIKGSLVFIIQFISSSKNL